MPWVAIKLERIKVGNSLRVNSGLPFVVQQVIGKRGFSLEVLTDQGVPIEIRDTDQVLRLDH